jgi:hypothetical protein
VIVPWEVYEWYGNRAVLAASYATMKRFVDYLRTTSDDLVPKAGLGDWYDYGHGKPVGASQFTPVELSAMATFYRCARIVADTAEVLGKSEDARAYDSLAKAIGQKFHQRYFAPPAEYRNQGSPQTANSMALALDLVPLSLQAGVVDRVVADIWQRGNQQTAGDIGHWYLLESLARYDRHQVVYDLTARTNLGSYGFIVNNGWTSMPEAWDADTGASMNHCMLGHIQEWFLGHLAGIRPDPAAPGFARFIIAPQPVGDLTWARGTYDSIRGRIVSDWKRAGDRFALRVRVPPNTSAQVRLPVRGAEKVTEHGQPLHRVAGVKLTGADSAAVSLAVGSGDYVFEGVAHY